MYVKVYLEDDELHKFLAGQPCEGHFVHYSEDHRYNEVLVPREQVRAEENGAFFGPRLIAKISG